MTNQPQHYVSFVLATHNRRDVTLDTLQRLSTYELDPQAGLAGRGDFEIILVDNASTDGSADRLESHVDQLIRLDHNAGSCAKAYGVQRATGRYIVFLDDDSFPRAGSIRRMLERFDADPKLAAAGFTVHLPGGRREGGALPGVFVGCGVGFRADALRRCGGLDATFFMQAEEYDLAFRLVAAGWRVDVFDDLHVEHHKTMQARRSQRTIYYDTRNNLRVAARYLRGEHYQAYRADWVQRYRWLAQNDGHESAFRRGLRDGRRGGWLDRLRFHDRRLDSASLERFFGWSCIERAMSDLVKTGTRRLVFAGLGKNVYAYYRAARSLDVHIVAIGHDRFARPGRAYRGVPVVSLKEALAQACDAIVVADSSAVHGVDLANRVAVTTDTPVHHWFHATDKPSLQVDGVGLPACDEELRENRLPRPAQRSDQSSEETQPIVAG